MGLPQWGGEGKENYKGNKSDSNLPQHGGEGKDLGTRGSDVGFTPKRGVNTAYTGQGRNLNTQTYTR